jgi:Acyl-CoA reductase (LuxC)
MTVEQVIPCAAQVDLDRTLAQLTAPGVPLAPFSDEVIGLCADFSRRLFRDEQAARYPELHALAYWMRKAELVRLGEEFANLKTQGAVLVPHGLVFHIPPANVDTIFVYSWLVSVLTGNRNVVRLSPRAAEQTGIICRVFNEALASAPERIRGNTVVLRYGHEREITQTISAAADVRILWGGDASVNAVRSIPLPPHARELTFPDRYSFAMVRTSRYLEAEMARRQQLAGEFFNDVFWFDQMACSSPRLLIWLGDADETDMASREFLDLVQAHAKQRGYQVQPQTRLNRFSFACRSVLDGYATGYRDLSELVVLDVDTSRRLNREHCGGGLLFQSRISALAELEHFVTRRDQTMTCFGFDAPELEALAARLNGLDRIVPFGKALNFSRFWDGYDLLQELTRHVSIG